MKRTRKQKKFPREAGRLDRTAKQASAVQAQKRLAGRGIYCLRPFSACGGAVLAPERAGKGRRTCQRAAGGGDGRNGGEGAYFLLSAMEDAQEQIQVESCMALSDGENFSLSGPCSGFLRMMTAGFICLPWRYMRSRSRRGRSPSPRRRRRRILR